MTEPDWKRLEYLAAEIQRELSPNARISHNVKLPGIDSGVDRQIDVLIEDHVGQFPIRIAIECKDYKQPADVMVVDAFQGLMGDTRVSKGVLVCPGGFTKAALARAAKLQIETYRPVDTDPHKWTCAVSLPTICDFRGASIHLRLSFSEPIPCRIPANTSTMVVFDADKKPLGTVGEIVAAKWDGGRFPTSPGHHEYPVGDTREVLMDNGYGTIAPFSLTAILDVQRHRYFGQTPVEKVKGFEDVQTGALVTNAFQLGLLDPEIVTSQWQEIGDSAPPSKPALLISGLYCFGITC